MQSSVNIESWPLEQDTGSRSLERKVTRNKDNLSCHRVDIHVAYGERERGRCVSQELLAAAKLMEVSL